MRFYCYRTNKLLEGDDCLRRRKSFSDGHPFLKVESSGEKKSLGINKKKKNKKKRTWNINENQMEIYGFINAPKKYWFCCWSSNK